MIDLNHYEDIEFKHYQVKEVKYLDKPHEINYEEVFKKYLPDSLYYTHYELAELHGGTPLGWREYLRDNQRFIDSEIAALAEPAARAALNRMRDASSSEVQALKALLEKSKLINESQKQAEKVILTFIPPHAFEEEEKQPEPIQEEPTPDVVPEPEPEKEPEPEPEQKKYDLTNQQDRREYAKMMQAKKQKEWEAKLREKGLIK